MQVHPDALKDPTGVYAAPALREAKHVEELLTARGVHYAVEVELLGRSTLFGSPRHGAVFYVSSDEAAECRRLLVDAGFARGLVEDDNREPPA